MTRPFRTVLNNVVNFSIDPDKLCPCGSGKSVEGCCFSEKGLFKLPSIVSPKEPQTEASLQGCYASSLNDCSNKLSREHYVSDSLLQYLNRDKALTVSGFPWMNGEEKRISPNALASKILCQRHNSSLSALDAIAVRLFKAFDESGVTQSDEKILHLFSGTDLERWLLKMLCGFAFSGNLKTDREADLSIPYHWLDILFGKAEFSGGHGLYVCKEPGHLFKGPTGLMLRPITDKEKLSGLGLFVCGYEFILSMKGFPNRRFDDRSFAYRPFEFYHSQQDYEKSIIFSWNGESDGGTISTIGN